MTMSISTKNIRQQYKEDLESDGFLDNVWAFFLHDYDNIDEKMSFASADETDLCSAESSEATEQEHKSLKMEKSITTRQNELRKQYSSKEEKLKALHRSLERSSELLRKMEGRKKKAVTIKPNQSTEFAKETKEHRDQLVTIEYSHDKPKRDLDLQTAAQHGLDANIEWKNTGMSTRTPFVKKPIPRELKVERKTFGTNSVRQETIQKQHDYQRDRLNHHTEFGTKIDRGSRTTSPIVEGIKLPDPPSFDGIKLPDPPSLTSHQHHELPTYNVSSADPPDRFLGVQGDMPPKVIVIDRGNYMRDSDTVITDNGSYAQNLDFRHNSYDNLNRAKSDFEAPEGALDRAPISDSLALQTRWQRREVDVKSSQRNELVRKIALLRIRAAKARMVRIDMSGFIDDGRREL